MSPAVTVSDTLQAQSPPAHLTLIVPGLVPDLSDQAVAEGSVGAQEGRASSDTGTPSSPWLERFDWQGAPGVISADADEPWECTLMRVAGLPVMAAERLPTARVRWTLESDVNAEPPQHIVCADPVHLQVERDSISVIPPQALSITREEAQACALSINDLLSGDGLELVVATANHWYLTGLDAQGLEAAPTHAVARRKVPTSVAGDAASSRWRQLNSELQMLLHTHPVNIDRASRGLRPVNSVWFSGGAALPAPNERDSSRTVYSTDEQVLAFSQVLGMATGSLEHGSTPAGDEAPLLTSPHVIWVDLSLYRAWLTGEPEAIAAARAALVEGVIVPALGWLDEGSLSSVRIEAGEGQQAQAVPATRAPSSLKTMTLRLLSRLGIGSSTGRLGR